MDSTGCLQWTYLTRVCVSFNRLGFRNGGVPATFTTGIGLACLQFLCFWPFSSLWFNLSLVGLHITWVINRRMAFEKGKAG